MSELSDYIRKQFGDGFQNCGVVGDRMIFDGTFRNDAMRQPVFGGNR